MGDAADDARDTEEMWNDLKEAHTMKACEEDCPYCNPDFKPLFGYQSLTDDAISE